MPSITKPPAPNKVQNYDIAVSFAGENRPYVEEVANGLKAAGVSVFYDGFEKADTLVAHAPLAITGSVYQPAVN